MVKPKIVDVIVLGGVLLIVLSFFLSNSHGRPSRAWTEMMAIAASLYAYHLEYGNIPLGDASAVVKVLGAINTDNQNPKKLLFHNVDRLHVDKHDMWVDDWGSPILLLRHDSIKPVLRSYGKNRRDDGGTNDDISVRVILPGTERHK